MSTPRAPSLAHTLTANLQQIRSQIARLNAQAMARQSGFLQRTPRKISLPDFLLALVALAAEATLSLERIAAAIGLVAQMTYAKQALHKRLNAPVENALTQVVTALFGELGQRVRAQRWLPPFRRGPHYWTATRRTFRPPFPECSSSVRLGCTLLSHAAIKGAMGRTGVDSI